MLQNTGLQLIMLNARLTKLPATNFWGHIEQSAQNDVQMVVSVADTNKTLA